MDGNDHLDGADHLDDADHVDEDGHVDDDEHDGGNDLIELLIKSEAHSLCQP